MVQESKADDVRRMRELIGLPVRWTEDKRSEELHLTAKGQEGPTGQPVVDILFDECSSTLLGILVEESVQQGIWVDRQDVVSITPEEISVRAFTPYLTRGRLWSEKVGVEVFDADGRGRGTIGDVFVDSDFRRVLGYEISDGLFADIVKGRDAVWKRDIVQDTEGRVITEGGLEP